jgi:hypothetical protein
MVNAGQAAGSKRTRCCMTLGASNAVLVSAGNVDVIAERPRIGGINPVDRLVGGALQRECRRRLLAHQSAYQSCLVQCFYLQPSTSEC